MELTKICEEVNQSHQEDTFQAIRKLFVAVSFHNTARLLSQDPGEFDDDGASFEVAVEIHPVDSDNVCLALDVCSNLDDFTIDEEVAEELVDNASIIFDEGNESLNAELKNQLENVFYGVVLKVNGVIAY